MARRVTSGPNSSLGRTLSTRAVALNRVPVVTISTRLMGFPTSAPKSGGGLSSGTASAACCSSPAVTARSPGVCGVCARAGMARAAHATRQHARNARRATEEEGGRIERTSGQSWRSALGWAPVPMLPSAADGRQTGTAWLIRQCSLEPSRTTRRSSPFGKGCFSRN